MHISGIGFPIPKNNRKNQLAWNHSKPRTDYDKVFEEILEKEIEVYGVKRDTMSNDTGVS